MSALYILGLPITPAATRDKWATTGENRPTTPVSWLPSALSSEIPNQASPQRSPHARQFAGGLHEACRQHLLRGTAPWIL